MHKPIAVGSDHAGFDYKEKLISFLEGKGLAFTDFGTHSNDSVDYPDYAHPVASAVEKGEAAFGILICGSANGVAITANKHQGVRAAICWGEEIAKLPLVTLPDGLVLTVGDLGRVRDGFADVAGRNRINGRPGLVVSIDPEASLPRFYGVLLGVGMLLACARYLSDERTLEAATGPLFAIVAARRPKTCKMFAAVWPCSAFATGT